jgi:hypothetical protein
MFPLNPSVLLLLCSAVSGINGQIESPIAPPEILQDITLHKALEPDSTACDEAVSADQEVACPKVVQGVTTPLGWDLELADRGTREQELSNESRGKGRCGMVT